MRKEARIASPASVKPFKNKSGVQFTENCPDRRVIRPVQKKLGGKKEVQLTHW